MRYVDEVDRAEGWETDWFEVEGYLNLNAVRAMNYDNPGQRQAALLGEAD